MAYIISSGESSEGEQYAMLAQAGSFLDFTSERIFEETGKGVLASL